MQKTSTNNKERKAMKRIIIAIICTISCNLYSGCSDTQLLQCYQQQTERTISEYNPNLRSIAIEDYFGKDNLKTLGEAASNAPYFVEDCPSSSHNLEEELVQNEDNQSSRSQKRKRIITTGNRDLEEYVCEIDTLEVQTPFIRTDNKKIYCQHKDSDNNICNKEFKLKGDFERHARTHEGLRPYQCTICKKTFTQKGNVHRHLPIHFKSRFSSQALVRLHGMIEVFRPKIEDGSYVYDPEIQARILNACVTYITTTKKEGRIYTSP